MTTEQEKQLRSEVGECELGNCARWIAEVEALKRELQEARDLLKSSNIPSLCQCNECQDLVKHFQ